MKNKIFVILASAGYFPLIAMARVTDSALVGKPGITAKLGGTAILVICLLAIASLIIISLPKPSDKNREKIRETILRWDICLIFILTLFSFAMFYVGI